MCGYMIQATEDNTMPPDWISQFIDRVVSDINHGIGRASKTAFTLTSVSDWPCSYYMPGNGEWGYTIAIRLRDTDSGEEHGYKLVFNFKDGNAYLSNGYNRVGFTYKIGLSDRQGTYAE